MTKDDQTPATKADIRAIRDDVNVVKADIRAVRNDMNVFKEEILRHFGLTVETIRHNPQGANRDEIGTIKDRVTRLEHHTGLISV